ncbi:MAG: hypothetical protein PSV35_07840 [bacterium]|nr:hypothetical protein [bacterium]
MTLKQFASGVFNFPARVFGGLVALIAGDYARNRNDVIKDGEASSGLLGLVMDGAKLLLDGVKFLGRSITNFVKNHKQAIASAFWASLVVGGAAALTVALWPAALAAVTSFTIAGMSIAALVGTGFVAQVAATAGVAALVTSAAVYAAATVANVFSAIKSLFTAKETVNQNPATTQYGAGSAVALSSLNSAAAYKTVTPAHEAPVHTAAIFPVPVSQAAEDAQAQANKTMAM